MFCPQCGVEYREGFSTCADCDVTLVDRPPVEPSLSSGELITVLETHEQGLVMVAKSLLDGAGIPYFAKNDQLQDFFGWGRIGAGYNVVVGAVRIQVPREYEEEARAVLTEVPDENGDA